MLKILVVGAGGQLGKEVVLLLEKLQTSSNGTIISFSAFDREALDITNFEQVKTIFDNENPDCVINCAAYTAVDKAESDIENAYLINEHGAKNVAQACAGNGAKLIHISTDYVFNGKKDSPYVESDQTDPQSVYGLSKLKGEHAVQSVLSEHVILRISWVFGLHGNNFVKSILRLAGEREELRIVADQLGCPSSTVNVATVIQTIAQQICHPSFKVKNYGIYHYCDAPETTWFGLASAVVESANHVSTGGISKNLKVKNIIPIMTHEYPTPAKRPTNSRLDTNKVGQVFNIQQKQWRPQLDTMIQEIITNEI